MPRLYSKKFLLLSAWWRINWIYFLLLGLVLAFNNAQLNAQAVWESSSPTSNQGDDSGNSPTFTRPASTAAGDLLVVAIFDEKGSGVTWTPPTGWQLIRTTNNSGNFGVKTFFKIATASEPNSYVFSPSTSGLFSGSISRFTNVDPINPIGVTSGNSGSSGGAVSPSITPTADGSLVLSFHGRKNSIQLSQDLSTSLRHQYNTGNNPYSNLLSTLVVDKDVATGNKTATGSTSGNWAAQQIAINPGPKPFPYVVRGGTFINNSESNSHSFTFPNSVRTGDLLVVVFRTKSGTRVSTLPSGWTELTNVSNNGISYVYYKEVESNSETFNFSAGPVSGGNGRSRIAASWYQISNWEGDPVFSTNNSIDPPNLSFPSSWGSDPSIVITGMTTRGVSTISPPSNFSGFISSSNSSNDNNNFQSALGFQEVEATSLNPGTFTRSSASSPVSFTIAIKGKKKVLTVTANPLSKVYGQADPELTYTVTGFQGADNESVLTGSLSRTAGQNVGAYTINQGDLAAEGYTIEFIPADFSITPKNLSITPDEGQFKLIGESDPASLAYQVSGFEFSDNASLLSGSLVRDVGEAVGFYEIRQGDLSISGSNYILDFASGIFFEIRSNPTQYIVSVSSQNPRKGTTITVLAQLADVNGSVIPEAGRTVTWVELTGTSGVFSSATSVTNTQGVATVQFTTSSTVGVSTKITAEDPGGLFGTSPEIITVDAVPIRLVYLQSPSGTTEAGQPFAQQPIIEIQDEEGNRVESASAFVSLSLESGSGELRGEIALQAVNGLATFSGLNIDLVGDDKVILAESEGLISASSGVFSILAGPAAVFTRFAGIQQVAAIGTAVTTPPAVQVQDIFGNPISDVSVSFEVTSGGGSIQPTTAVLTDMEGIAALSSWTLGSNPGPNTVEASASGFTSLTFTALGSEDAIREFSTDTIWTVPAGVTEITVEAWGAGGGGGGVDEGKNRIGAGGGGGAYAKKVLAVTPNQVLNISIGTGGTAGTRSTNGGNGGDSFVSFNSSVLVIAKGGIGGQSRTSSNSAPRGGAGGSVDESIGDLRTVGGNGENGSGTGGSTGEGGNGANGGAGGAARTSRGNGNPGNSPGGGGGGGRDDDRDDRIGGAGGSGKIIITYPKPVNQFRAASSGNWEDNATWEQQFSNGQFAKIDSKPVANSTVIISGEELIVTVSENLSISGAVTVNSSASLTLASGKSLTLNSGAILTVGNNGLLGLPENGVLQGAGNFVVNKGGTLAIAHPEGIKASGTSGAIQNSGTRSFSTEAKYLYNGSKPQTVGDGLPAVVNSLIIDNISGVTLDRPLEVTLDLVMNAGALELDQSLMVDLGMKLNGSAQLVVKEGVSFTADLLSNLTTNQTSRIVLQPGAKYSNLGTSTPRLEVRQRLTGVKGWRMLGSPVTGATYLNFLSGLESQGFAGSANPSLQPNVLWWDETDGGTTLQGWRQPTNISESVPNGRGHYVYVFDGGPKSSGGTYTDNLPLTLSALGTEFNLNTGGFDFGVTYTPRDENFKGDVQSGTYTQVETANEGFNLIANPTASYIDFFNESGWTKEKIDETIYIWDQNFNDGQGDFLEVTEDTPEAQRLIAPFQGFWVRTSQENPSLILTNEAKSFASSLFYGRVFNEQPAVSASKINLTVHGEGLKAHASLRISDQGQDGIDPWDAFQLESLNSTWLNLYSLGSPEQTDPLVINHLSLPEEGEKTIPLYMAAAKAGKPFSGQYTLTWELPAEWPADIRVVLMDHINQKAIDMSEARLYEFDFEAPTSTNMRIRTEEGAMKQPQAVVFSHEVQDGKGAHFRTASGSITRPFTIVIGYSGEGANPEYRPDMPKLYAPSPNPFVDRTKIKFYLPVEEAAEVKIYDMAGQQVGAFEPRVYPAGIHTLDWEPRAVHLPIGVYLIHVLTRDQVLVQKALKF